MDESFDHKPPLVFDMFINISNTMLHSIETIKYRFFYEGDPFDLCFLRVDYSNNQYFIVAKR